MIHRLVGSHYHLRPLKLLATRGTLGTDLLLLLLLDAIYLLLVYLLGLALMIRSHVEDRRR